MLNTIAVMAATLLLAVAGAAALLAVLAGAEQIWKRVRIRRGQQ